MLPLLETGTTHVIVAALHINSRESITLNDAAYDDALHLPIWQETKILQRAGVKVFGMLGGAHQGSFTRLDGDVESFEAHYKLLERLIRFAGLDGLDLDVEEAMSLSSIIRLINRLKRDFGRGFLVTLAPVATAMWGLQNLSGFDYEALEKAFATEIAWYNTQFYCGWGCMKSTSDYDRIVARGWLSSKIVVGLVTNPANCAGWIEDELLRKVLMALKQKYPDLGGVMGWEYFNSMTEEDGEGKPWVWARWMTRVLHHQNN